MESQFQSGDARPSRLDDLIDRAVAEDILEEPLAGETSDATLPSDLSGVLGGLLSNPAILSKIPQLMSSLGPLMGGLGGGHGKGKPGGSSAHGKMHLDRHTALLCAVKPYLCAERQQMAEYLIGLCRMGDVLQKMPSPTESKREEGGDDRV